MLKIDCLVDSILYSGKIIYNKLASRMFVLQRTTKKKEKNFSFDVCVNKVGEYMNAAPLMECETTNERDRKITVTKKRLSHR